MARWIWRLMLPVLLLPGAGRADTLSVVTKSLWVGPGGASLYPEPSMFVPARGKLPAGAMLAEQAEHGAFFLVCGADGASGWVLRSAVRSGAEPGRVRPEVFHAEGGAALGALLTCDALGWCVWLSTIHYNELFDLNGYPHVPGSRGTSATARTVSYLTGIGIMLTAPVVAGGAGYLASEFRGTRRGLGPAIAGATIGTYGGMLAGLGLGALIGAATGSGTPAVITTSLGGMIGVVAGTTIGLDSERRRAGALPAGLGCVQPPLPSLGLVRERGRNELAAGLRIVSLEF